MAKKKNRNRIKGNRQVSAPSKLTDAPARETAVEEEINANELPTAPIDGEKEEDTREVSAQTVAEDPYDVRIRAINAKYDELLRAVEDRRQLEIRREEALRELDNLNQQIVQRDSDIRRFNI